MKKLLLSIIFIASIAIQAQIITTVAGDGTQGYSGDGGQATNAELSAPSDIVFDLSGNIYIADFFNSRVRKINTVGIISTIAGSGGTGNYSGDGGQATAAQIGISFYICFDSFDNLFITDGGENRVRMINTSGIIMTTVGNGTGGYSGDGGPATGAELNNPSGLAFDAIGNMYISDQDNNVIRMVTSTGIISTIAGNGTQGYSGDGGQASLANLYLPRGLAFNNLGELYFADEGNNRIRKISTSGIISTIAGNGTGGYSGDGGSAILSELYKPIDITFDNDDNLYIADTDNNRIRKINTSGIITTIAGNGIQGYSGDGGMAINAEIHGPVGVTIDALGNLFIADDGNNRIRKVTNVASIGIEQVKDNKEQITIYPNPATNSLQVSFVGNSESSTLVMTDMLGNTVKQMPFNTQYSTISVADVEAGVYFITVTSGATTTTQKVIVNK